jgi:hypothetical protein
MGFASEWKRRCLVIWGLFSPCAFPAAFTGEATFFLLDISASAP